MLNDKTKLLIVFVLMTIFLYLQIVSSMPSIYSNFVNQTVFPSTNGNITAFITANSTSMNYSIDGGTNYTLNRYFNDWKFEANDYHTNYGVNYYSYAPLTNNTLWIAEEITGTYDEYSSIIVYNDTLYLGSKAFDTYTGNNNLTALNATNGTLIWTVDTKGEIDVTPMLDTQDYNVLWIATYNETDMADPFFGLIKVNRTDGIFLCNLSTGGDGPVAGLEQDALHVFTGTYRSGNTLYSINKADCSVNWSVSVPLWDTASPNQPFYKDDKVVFLGESTGYTSNTLRVLNATNGTLIWGNKYFNVYHDMQARVLPDGNLWVASGGNTAYNNISVYNFTNGNIVWNKQYEDYFYTKPTYYLDSVFFGLRDARLITRLNFTDPTHAEICNLTVNSNVNADLYNEPTCADGVCYVGSNLYSGNLSNDMIAFNATNCSIIWKYTSGGIGTWSRPAITDGIVYWKNNMKRVLAFGKEKLNTHTANFSSTSGSHTLYVYASDIDGDINTLKYTFNLTGTSTPASGTTPDLTSGDSTSSGSSSATYFNVGTSNSDLDLTIPVNGSLETSIRIKNIASSSIIIRISISDLSNFIVTYPEETVIQKNETKYLLITIKPLENTPSGTYSGKITMSSLGDTKKLDLKLRVLPPENSSEQKENLMQVEKIKKLFLSPKLLYVVLIVVILTLIFTIFLIIKIRRVKNNRYIHIIEKRGVSSY